MDREDLLLELMKTHIYAYHEEHGKIVDFGGWAMPVWYEGIIPEHHAVRNGVGMFDTSHMGRTVAKGPDVERFVNWVVTNDVSRLEPSKGLYALMLRPHAGIVDDPARYRWSGHGEILGRVKNPIVDVDEVLRLFGTTRRSVRAAYVQRLKGVMEEEKFGLTKPTIRGKGKTFPQWRNGVTGTFFLLFLK